MLARRTLLQLTTKLAIGLGALFLVGVLLAAIPNHRAPVVEGVSTEQGQGVQETAPAKTPKNDAVRGVAQRHATAPKAGDSSK